MHNFLIKDLNLWLMFCYMSLHSILDDKASKLTFIYIHYDVIDLFICDRFVYLYIVCLPTKNIEFLDRVILLIAII